MTGCQEEYQYFSKNIVGPFDTVTTYITYAHNEEGFNKQCQMIEEKLNYYDQLFDKYSSYNEFNNVYTINQNAGKKLLKLINHLLTY